MLTDLSFLDIGKNWLPDDADTRKRIDMYMNNRLLFENEHATVYKEQFKRIERVIANFQSVVSYPVIANFQRLISLKTADLLLGEPPKIFAGEANSKESQTVETIIDNNDLINTAYQAAIDVSRYGDGLFYVYQGENGGVIDVTQPSVWFPVVSPDNVKRIIYHVLAWTYTVGKNKYLKVQIHDKGIYEEREYQLKDSKIDQLMSSKTVTTGLNDFAIVQIPNTITSDRVTGIDDYTDIDSIVAEILVRVGQISNILDKHANPSVSGPHAALEKDPVTEEWHLKMGTYFPRDSQDEPEVKYITWDGQLEANFNQIEKLINLLYIISEMGAILLGDTDKMGNAPSGTAMRLKMMSPLAKARRIAMRFSPALKKAIKLCSQLGGKNIVNLSDTAMSITWQDGLANDDTETSNIINLRTGGKPTMSQKRVLMQYDGLSEDDAEAELALIDEEEAKANPFKPTPFNNVGE